MVHHLACRAAVDGKRPVSKKNRPTGLFAQTRRLTFAAVAFFMASASASYAQSSPFAGLSGNWTGGGTVSLDDGSRERIRCRASYQVAGPRMTMNLTCASDAYKFNLSADVVAEGSAVSGSWTEATRNVSGTLQGRGGGGNFQVVATTATFNANISLRTVGNKQSVTMRADSQFRGADISLSK
jgi:hypothetical protein